MGSAKSLKSLPKRAKLLADANGPEGNQHEATWFVDLDGDTELASTNGFKINKDYARRFEYNKKREELEQLEEKYKDSASTKRKRHVDDGLNQSPEEDSSSSESEDDDAELATAELDQEISATLQAIKSKHPKVYDKSVKFYKEFEEEPTEEIQRTKTEKPLHLHDYHRQNLLNGYTGDETQEDVPVPTYQQEQDKLRREVVGSMHAPVNSEDESEDNDDAFLVAKSMPKHQDLPNVKRVKITDEDVKVADKDPETFLSNFMASRAWLPTERFDFQGLESDDSDEEARADAFEGAYNLRFEDPKTANERLQSFARDVGKYGVRREERSGRKKIREQERERKEEERRARAEEKARLRKLKIEDVEEKVKRIKEAAGLGDQEIDLQQWRGVIEGDFDDEAWEREMSRRFGEEYYAKDGDLNSDGGASSSKDRKLKKPNWNDDIDINDLIPEFDNEQNPTITLSSDEADDNDSITFDAEEGEAKKSLDKAAKKKQIAKDKADARRTARRERMKIEEMVDASLPIDHPDITVPASSKAPAAGFQYRDTSPTTFGLSARDILFADDSQLNQYAGLKKLTAFRDPEKKRKDKKKFSKKGRLKQWRKETFGNTEEPVGGFERVLGDYKGTVAGGMEQGETNVNDKPKKKKKRRNRKGTSDGEANVN